MGTRFSRRRLLRDIGRYTAAGSVLAGAEGPLLLRRSSAAVPSEQVRLGLIGCGNRRKQLIPAFLASPDAQIVAICDVAEGRLQAAKQLVQEQNRPAPELYGDYQKILDRRDIDAVVIATPEHWKCLPTVQACQAGKDVYVEKPLALTIVEGRRMVQAARRHNRVAMIGTQQRSMRSYQEAVEFIHSGKLGKISEVRSWNFENLAPEGYGRPRDSDPPRGLDWEMWLGPARKVQYNPNRYGQFHFFWDYGGGWQCDWGVHMFDVVHWAMKTEHPVSATACGGKFARNDNTEHPDTFEAVFEYDGFISVYSYRHGNGRPFEDMWYGNAFFGERGTLAVNRDGWRVIPEPVESRNLGRGLRMEGLSRPGTPVEGPHQQLFIEYVKTRKQPPIGDIETGHRSTIPGHLGNIAYRVGRKVHWDHAAETIKDDAEANKLLAPAYRKPWELPAI